MRWTLRRAVTKAAGLSVIGQMIRSGSAIVNALASAAGGRQHTARGLCTSIHTLAGRLRIPYDEAVALAGDCAQSGLATHDQSQHTKARRRAAELRTA